MVYEIMLPKIASIANFKYVGYNTSSFGRFVSIYEFLAIGYSRSYLTQNWLPIRIASVMFLFSSLDENIRC